MKKIKVITSIAVLIILLLHIFPTICKAEPLQINTDEYRPTNITDYDQAEEVGKKIADILRTVGVIVAVIAITILGIKYMLGSVEQRAEYKKTMKPILIGILMLFGIVTFLSIIANVTKSFD